MKKALVVILTVVLCLAMLVACNKPTDYSNALTTLDALYANKTETNESYNLVGSVSFNGSSVKIHWEINDKPEGIDIVPTANGYTVQIASTVTTAQYVLVGYIVDDQGNAITNKNAEPYAVVYNCVVNNANQGGDGGSDVGGDGGEDVPTPPAPVSDNDGTIAKPYTVAEALAIGNQLAVDEKSNKCHITGVIVDAGAPSTSGSYVKNVIIADSANSATTLTISSCNFNDGHSIADLAVGKTVVVEGYVRKYADGMSFGSGGADNKDYAYFISISGQGTDVGGDVGGDGGEDVPTPPTPVSDNDGTLAKPYTVAETLAIGNQLAVDEKSNKCHITGVIVDAGAPSTSGSYVKNVIIADSANSATTLTISSCNFNDGHSIADLAVGKTVVIEGYVRKYADGMSFGSGGADNKDYAYFISISGQGSDVGGDGGEDIGGDGGEDVPTPPTPPAPITGDLAQGVTKTQDENGITLTWDIKEILTAPTNAELASGILLDEIVTVKFYKNNAVDPTYNASSKEIRLYYKGTVEISVPTGYEIKSIEITYTVQSGKKVMSLASEQGDASSWTGNATEVTFATDPADASSGHAKITQITVVYVEANTAK